MPTRNYWQSYTPTVSLEGLAEFNRQKEIEKENRLIGLKHLIETQGRQIAKENIKDYLTESNDNAWVEYNYTQPKAKNKHSHRQNVDKMMHTKEDVEAMTLGGIAPLAIMSAPLWGPSIIAGGDALASSALGKVITKGFTNPYTNALATSAFGAHGLNHAINEGINGWGDAAMTALEVAPLGGLIIPTTREITTIAANYKYPTAKLPTKQIDIANNLSFIDGKPEIGMYLNSDGKTFDIKRIAEDLGEGVVDARLFLGSDVKATTDAYNSELAKRIGFSKFTPYKNAQERASIKVKPTIYTDKKSLAGYVKKNVGDPSLDEFGVNILYDANNTGFHETLHRGNYGEAGFSFNPKTMNFNDYHQIQEDTRNFYKFKTNKLLVPKTLENSPFHEYMSNSAEASVNSMEIGRRMGIKPGTPWPGRKEAMKLFEEYSNSKDVKTKVFNVLNWKQKPRRVWDALTGKYFTLGTGGFAIERSENNKNSYDRKNR